MQDNSQNRQLYLNFMKTSTQFLKSQGIVDQINERNIQQWKTLKPDERIKYFNFMQQSLLQPEVNQRKIDEFMKPKRAQGPQQVEINTMDLIKDYIQSNKAFNDTFTTKTEHTPQKCTQLSTLAKPLKTVKQQNPQEIVIDIFEDFKTLNQSNKSPQERKNQNQEYINYYKEQYKILQRQSPYKSSLEITKIVKESWKQFKMLKKVYQDETSPPIQKKVQTESLIFNRTASEKKECISVANPVTEIPTPLNDQEKQISFSEAVFHLIIEKQVIKIKGELLLQAIKNQNKQEVYIDLTQMSQAESKPIKIDPEQDNHTRIKREQIHKGEKQFEGDSFVMSISDDDAQGEISLRENQTSSENVLSIEWDDKSDNLLENLTISDSSEFSYPNLLNQNEKLKANPLINILKQNI